MIGYNVGLLCKQAMQLLDLQMTCDHLMQTSAHMILTCDHLMQPYDHMVQT